jgi:hypothetical protein
MTSGQRPGLYGLPTRMKLAASTIGAANAGTISSLMPLTAMRQLQVGIKVRL